MCQVPKGYRPLKVGEIILDSDIVCDEHVPRKPTSIGLFWTNWLKPMYRKSTTEKGNKIV